MRPAAQNFRLLLPTALATLALVACGGSSDGSSPDPDDGTVTSEPDATTSDGPNDSMPIAGEDDARDLSATPTWRLDDRFDYAGSLAASLTRVSNTGSGDFGILALPVAGPNDGNGAWSGSAIALAHSLDGDGSYTVVDVAGFDRTLEESPGSRVVRFTVQAGTSVADGSTQWEAAGGTLEVVVDEAGVYHFFSDEPVPLRVTLDVGAGIPDRPNDTAVVFSNVHGRPPL